MTDEHLVRRLPGRVVAYELKTGKEVFTADLPPAEGEEVRVADVPVVFGETVVPSRAGTRVLDINSSAVRSMPNPDASCKSRAAALFGGLLLVHAYCDENDDNATNRLRAFDANLQLACWWRSK